MEEAGVTLFFIQHLHFLLLPGDLTQWYEREEPSWRGSTEKELPLSLFYG